MFWSKHERSPSSGPKEADAGRNPSGIPVGHIVGDPEGFALLGKRCDMLKLQVEAKVNPTVITKDALVRLRTHQTPMAEGLDLQNNNILEVLEDLQKTTDTMKSLSELPELVSAGGIRPGVINFGLARGVAPEFLCHNTGHVARMTARVDNLGARVDELVAQVVAAGSKDPAEDFAAPQPHADEGDELEANVAAEQHASEAAVMAASFLPMASGSDIHGPKLSNKTLATQKAVDVFREMMAKRRYEPACEDKRKAMQVRNAIQLFAGLATDEEMAILLPPAPGKTSDEGERRKVARLVNRLVGARLRDAYRSHPTKDVPDMLRVNAKHRYEPTVGAIDSRFVELGKACFNPAVDLSRSALQAWRTSHEAASGGAGAGASPPPVDGGAKKRRREDAAASSPEGAGGGEHRQAAPPSSSAAASSSGARGVLSRMFAAASSLSPSRRGQVLCSNVGCSFPTIHKCRHCDAPVCTICCGKLRLEGVYVCSLCNEMPESLLKHQSNNKE